uniref:Uncharacterized protein n=1 Tax=Xanthomonas campestris pv. glycines TaxID=473421 RepID=Q32XA4_XANCG|nr:hypothetical protein [Xanthomonas citri pv. glycines]AAX12217.1 hypothetical protein [Xanthomonas citri pv. glycines]
MRFMGTAPRSQRLPERHLLLSPREQPRFAGSPGRQRRHWSIDPNRQGTAQRPPQALWRDERVRTSPSCS